MELNTLWQKVSPDILNFLLQREFVRKMVLKKAEEKLYHAFVVKNEENRPLWKASKKRRMHAGAKGYSKKSCGQRTTSPKPGSRSVSASLRHCPRHHQDVQCKTP
jgi:hypothetical protein